MKLQRQVILFGIMLFVASSGYAWMEYFGSNPMGTNQGYPKELNDLLKWNSRVAESIGPFVDLHAYYAGDAEQLNTFIQTYAKAPDTRLQVYLHSGKFQINMAQYDRSNRKINVDWMLHLREYMASSDKVEDFQGKKILARLEVWLGDQIDLNKLDVPENLEVYDGGEIESFIKKHEEKQKQQNKGK